MINKRGKYESECSIVDDIINVKGDLIVNGNLTAETLLVDGRLFVSEDINVKAININGKVEAKCIKTNDLKVRGCLVCDKLSAQILSINGQVNCNSIESDSINLLLSNNNKIDKIKGRVISIDKYKVKDISTFSKHLKKNIPFFRFIDIDGIYNKFTENLNKETNIKIGEIDGGEIKVNNLSVDLIIYDTLDLGSECCVMTYRKREGM